MLQQCLLLRVVFSTKNNLKNNLKINYTVHKKALALNTTLCKPMGQVKQERTDPMEPSFEIGVDKVTPLVHSLIERQRAEPQYAINAFKTDDERVHISHALIVFFGSAFLGEETAKLAHKMSLAAPAVGLDPDENADRLLLEGCNAPDAETKQAQCLVLKSYFEALAALMMVGVADFGSIIALTKALQCAFEAYNRFLIAERDGTTAAFAVKPTHDAPEARQ